MASHSQVDAQIVSAPDLPRWRSWLRQSGRRWTRPAAWVFWIGFFTLVLFTTSRDYQRTHVHHSGWATFVVSLDSILNALWMGVVAWLLTSRYPIRRKQLGKSLGIHALGAAAVLLPTRVLGLLHELADFYLFAKPTMPLAQQVYVSIVEYIALLGVMHLLKYAFDTRRSEEDTLRLEAEVSAAARQRMEAELRALKAEVSPRFLIEAFETVSAVIATAPAKAEHSLAQLGDIVRSALHRGSTREVTLREELDGLKPFLELERARLGALDVEVEKDRLVLDALVPDLILQPIVSTILKGQPLKGIRPRLAIIAQHDEHSAGVLEITVEGWGTQPATTEAPDFTGSANIQSRLVEMYGDTVRLELTERAGTSRKARLLLPWRDIDAPDPQFEERIKDPSDSPSRRSQWMRAGAMVAMTAAFSVLVPPLDRQYAMLRRVYESSLPRFFFPLGNIFSGLLFTLVVYGAIDVNNRLSGPDGRWRSRPKLPTHTAAALLLGIVSCLHRGAMSLPYGIIADRSARHMTMLVLGTIYTTLGIYTITVVTALGITAIARGMRAKRDALRVQAEMNETVRRRAEAELRALQAELNPHFLGNALHTVSGLVRTAPDEASRLLRELQLLLRFPMSRSGAHEVSLAEELEALGPYLALERARIRRRLDVRWKVDHDALRGRVPRMILQPLVENAVKHGLVNQLSHDGGTIEVTARRVGARLEVAISDDGVGVDSQTSSAGKRGRHVGVANTHARLRELYGDQASFELVARVGGGTVARISVPWHEESASPAAATYAPSRAESMTLA